MGQSPAPQSPPGSPWMPATAGTLSIIAGAVQVLLGLLFIGASAEVARRRGAEGLGIVGLPFLILGIVAIIGGVFAAVRRAWPMALIGAITGAIVPIVALLRYAFVGSVSVRAGWIVLLFVLLVCGLSAVVLTIIGRRDFK